MKLRKCVSSPRSSLSAAQLQNKTEQGHLEQLQLLTQGNWRKAIKRVVWRTSLPSGFQFMTPFGEENTAALDYRFYWCADEDKYLC